MRSVILLLSLLAATLFPLLGDDENPMTKLTVKVTDERGKPLDRANVRVVFKQGRYKLVLQKLKHSWELKTSQQGTAKIPEIPKGEILIQVTAKAYQSYGETLTIEEDEKVVNVVLKKPQPPYSVHGSNDPTAKK
jgi:nitrogen fixation protein FixH